MIIVYRPTDKGVTRGKLNPADRLLFREDGSALLYRDDRLIQSDVAYRRPDSHVEKTEETMPLTLLVVSNELHHIRRHAIYLFGIELKETP